MSDKLHRFHLQNLHVRGEWVCLSSSWKQIQETANYPDPVRQVLGEALVAVSLLAESLKFDGSLILQVRGTQPVTMLVVQASADGAIRGIARWKGEIARDGTFHDLFGMGTLVISIENNPKPGAQQGERYQSLISLQGDSLADCLKEYFAQSEQLNTRLWLAVNEEKATGMMLQSLPSDEEELSEKNNESWNHATILANTVTDEELLGLDVEDILHRLYHEEDLRLYDSSPIRFECSCSQEKIENTIRSIGKAEAHEIIAEQGSINIECEFCNSHYELDSIDVTRLFSDADVTDLSGTGSVH